ncbi:MAG: hypothetical protein ACI936_002046 [Paraglaciecola sp.]|jgi:hypothetical protein
MGRLQYQASCYDSIKQKTCLQLILYMEEFTTVSTNEKYNDEIKRLTSLWLLNYLTRSAVSYSSPLGTSKTTSIFQVGINVQHHFVYKDYLLTRIM